MASFISICFFFFFFLDVSSAFGDLHGSRSIPRQPFDFSPLLASQASNDSSPTEFFEVTRPISNLPTKQPPCSHRILHHDFAYTYGKPPVLGIYTPPPHCPFQNFSRIVLEFKATCKGRQFDRIFGIWINGVEILRSCTAEPRPTGIVWSVKKDVTRYHSLLVKDETQILALYMGNLIDHTYTGIYHIDVIFHYYPVEDDVRTHYSNSVPGYGSYADMIVPMSRNLPLNDGLWFKVVNSTDIAYKEVEIPRNVYRAVLEVSVSFHENDEFWYGNFYNDYIMANNITSPGNGPFREVAISLDGDIVGAVWPFPVVFTGGINPLLWRPITAIGSFDLPTYDIEITPFLGHLLDGKPHKFGFSVVNGLNAWYIDANLHLWLDHKNEKVEGKLLEVKREGLGVMSSSNFKGLNGRFETKANRTITSTGLVKSSHGEIITKSVQEFRYENTMSISKDMNLQIVDQVIRVSDRVRAKKRSKTIHLSRSIKTFPFYMYSDSKDQGNDTMLYLANVSMAFNEKTFESFDRSKPLTTLLKNKQDGQGVMVAKDNLVVKGNGSTQQVYKYVGSDQCFFRNISSSNYSILYDKIETLCKKRLNHGIEPVSLPLLP